MALSDEELVDRYDEFCEVLTRIAEEGGAPLAVIYAIPKEGGSAVGLDFHPKLTATGRRELCKVLVRWGKMLQRTGMKGTRVR